MIRPVEAGSPLPRGRNASGIPRCGELVDKPDKVLQKKLALEGADKSCDAAPKKVVAESTNNPYDAAPKRFAAEGDENAAPKGLAPKGADEGGAEPEEKARAAGEKSDPRSGSAPSGAEPEEKARVIHIGGVPNPRQSAFFACRARYIAYGGARGGGKSWALRRKLIAYCLRYPGSTCLLIRRSLGELKANHLSAFLADYGEILSYRESEKCLYLPGGSRILFGFCGCDRDVLRYQGQEYDLIAIDEATQLSEYQFSVFKACLRGVRDCPRRMYLTCNPGGIGHGWVKRLFIDRDFRSGENPEDYAFIGALCSDNKVLLEKDPEYERRLRSLPPRLRDAWLYGKWDVFEGQFFPEFRAEEHVGGESPPGAQARRFLAFDYGFDMLAALCVAVTPTQIRVEKEICVPNLTLSEAAEHMVRVFRGVPFEYAVASPDLWNRRQDTGKSGFEIMQGVAGMPPMLPADDRRIPGWRVVHEVLSRGDGERVFRIDPGCRELIHDMESLLCDPDRREDAASHPHAITHAPEALRYALMSRLPRQAAPSAQDFADFFPQQKKSLWD